MSTTTKFVHDTATPKSLEQELMENLGVSRELNIAYPKVTPRASVAITNYSLKNSPNINRTILGSGLDVDFTIIMKLTFLVIKSIIKLAL